jgi:regulatory protein
MAWAFMAAKQEPRLEGRGDGPSLRARAMRFLARREHSRAELKRKLAARATEGEDLEVLLDDLAQRGWLSDARYAEQSIRAHARRFGPLKLAQQLRARGVDEESIAAGFQAAGTDGASSLEHVWRRRFHARPSSEREKAHQVRFLQGRGFALDEIFRFLKQPEPKP